MSLEAWAENEIKLACQRELGSAADVGHLL